MQGKLDGILNSVRNPHGRRRHEIRNGLVAGWHNHGLTHWQLTMEFSSDFRLNPRLQIQAKIAAIGKVDTAIHEAEAICGAHDSITAPLQDIALDDNDARHVTERLPPRQCHRRVKGVEIDARTSHWPPMIFRGFVGVALSDSILVNAWYGTKAIAKPNDSASMVHTGKFGGPTR
jgi:hypothetical protein